VPFDTAIIVRILTGAALSGLLLCIGLRLEWRSIVDALRRCRPWLLLAVNFVAVPALALGLGRSFGLGTDRMVGMILLAAAPFAPVVPVFARMARADLALAAGLTAAFPVVSAVLTPLVCVLALKMVPDSGALNFRFLGVLGILLASITLPLAAGIFARSRWPRFTAGILRPVEAVSEAIGALSLAFVTVTEWRTILETGWASLLAMAVLSELSFGLGWWVGGPVRTARQVIALGTGNRNIALAVLVAVDSFQGTPIVGAVVANGLLLILLGLLHVGWWRLRGERP
jgi:bile acid:Na+ symporter, BASS family